MSYLLELEEISEGVYYFLTSEFILGVIEKGKEVCFRHYT